MTWEPTEDDIRWTEEILKSMEPGKAWVEGEMTFLCSDENTLSLVSRTERAEEPARRVGIVVEKLGWKFIDEEVNVMPDDPLEMMQAAQEVAQDWTCPHCRDERLANCDLERAQWVSAGMQIAMEEDGQFQQHERWTVIIQCCQCNEEIVMQPMDYAMIAGEELFYSWRSTSSPAVTIDDEDMFELKCMHQAQIIDMVDNEKEIVTEITGSTWRGKPLPPHMQGTIVTVEEIFPTPIYGEEE